MKYKVIIWKISEPTVQIMKLRQNGDAYQRKVVLVLLGKSDSVLFIACFIPLLFINTWSKHKIGGVFTVSFHIAHSTRHCDDRFETAEKRYSRE